MGEKIKKNPSYNQIQIKYIKHVESENTWKKGNANDWKRLTRHSCAFRRERWTTAEEHFFVTTCAPGLSAPLLLPGISFLFWRRPRRLWPVRMRRPGAISWIGHRQSSSCRRSSGQGGPGARSIWKKEAGPPLGGRTGPPPPINSRAGRWVRSELG